MPTLDPELDDVALPPPALPAQATLERALRERSSSRSFSPDPLSLQELATLLWCAFGINRPSRGGRTAPSAHDWQEIDVHAVLPEGCYRYDARRHRLLRVRPHDLRAATGTQDFVATAPLDLVYVADFERMGGATPDDRAFLAAADAGCIAQNVYLYCACAALVTVVRGLVDRRLLADRLGLAPTQRIVLAQTVGRPAAPA